MGWKMKAVVGGGGWVKLEFGRRNHVENGEPRCQHVILLKEPLYLVAVSVAGGATKVPTPQNLTFFVFFDLSIDYNPHLHCSSLTVRWIHINN